MPFGPGRIGAGRCALVACGDTMGPSGPHGPSDRHARAGTTTDRDVREGDPDEGTARNRRLGGVRHGTRDGGTPGSAVRQPARRPDRCDPPTPNSSEARGSSAFRKLPSTTSATASMPKAGPSWKAPPRDCDGRGWRSKPALAGRAATVIVESVRDARIDLVIVGARGHGAIAQALLGSVSAEVVDQAHCAVLVARAGIRRATLIGTDGSDVSTAAITFVGGSGLLRSAATRLIHAIDLHPTWWLGFAAGRRGPRGRCLPDRAR